MTILKKIFLRETIFLDFLERNKINLTPKLLYKSYKKKFIKTKYLEDKHRSFYTKNKDKLIFESFNFIKKINSKNYRNKKFYLAKDFCKSEKDYKNEILRRIKMFKKSIIYKNNMKFKKLIKTINLMLLTLIQEGFFKKKILRK